MKLRTMTLAGALITGIGVMKAQDRDFGIGFIIGEPTGISMKAYVAPDRAIDGAIAWSLTHGQAFHLHADYLFHSFTAIKVNKGRLPVYYGPGIRVRTWNDGHYWHGGEWHDMDGSADLAVRFPVGLAYEFDGAPLDIFLEVVPALGIMPDTYFDFDGGLGMRFWF